MSLAEVLKKLEQLDCNGGTMIVLLFMVFSLVQIAPIQINPWTWLGHLLRAYLGIEDIRDELMDARRTRIIRFDDELLDKRQHRKDMFDAILIDCDKYEKYCMSHKGYVNSVAGDSIAHIKETYHDLKAHDGFLVKREA